MNKHKKHTILIVILLLLVLVLICCLRGCSSKEEISEESVVTEQTGGVKSSGSIAIPGYEVLELKADTLKQDICLKNPKENNCYFVITLMLEDGTKIWQSEYIKPNETTKPIKLNKKLQVGTYTNSILKYSCYSLDKEKTPLNGAELKVTLWVK